VAGPLRESISESLAAFRAVLGNPGLRLVESAGALAETGKWLYVVALLVYAHGVGGATAVGLVALIRVVPSAIVGPFTAVLADRLPRERIMFTTAVVRAFLFAGGAAAVALELPAGLVYAIAGLVTILATVFRPAEAAIMPSLARTPEELTAANVAASTIVSIGSFVGPAAGGLLLAATSVEVVFAATGAMFLLATLLLARLRVEGRPERAVTGEGLATEVFAGFRTIVADRNLRLLTGLYGAQTLVAGALTVLIVVVAIDLLDVGDSGVGYLNSAFGIGGFVGVGLTFLLIGRQRLAGDFAIGMILWGIPLIAIGLWTNTAVAIVLLAVIGVGDVLIEVAAPTLLQRAVPDEVLGRVFGAVESMIVAMMGIGAILAPVLIDGLGTRAALIATGALLPALAVLSWRRLARIDAETRVPVKEIGLLRGIPIFTPLGPPALEELAARLDPVELEAGVDVFRQGDPGERFYIVDEGEVEVRVDGTVVRRLGPGEYFGEIALLRDVPRTATVTAQKPGRLYALDRDEFIAAVTGVAESREAVNAVAGARLAHAKPPGLALE
jgi:MFS family permease